LFLADYLDRKVYYNPTPLYRYFSVYRWKTFFNGDSLLSQRKRGIELVIALFLSCLDFHQLLAVENEIGLDEVLTYYFTRYANVMDTNNKHNAVIQKLIILVSGR